MYVMGAANAEVMSGYNVVRRDAPPGYKFQSEPTLEYPRRSPRNAEERHGSAGARRASRRVGLADAIEPPARSRRRWGGWGALGLADAIEPPARSRRRWGGWGALGLADAIEPPARSRRRWGGWGALGLADAIEPPARSRRRWG